MVMLAARITSIFVDTSVRGISIVLMSLHGQVEVTDNSVKIWEDIVGAPNPGQPDSDSDFMLEVDTEYCMRFFNALLHLDDIYTGSGTCRIDFGMVPSSLPRAGHVLCC